jgi:hypothetical protein
MAVTMNFARVRLMGHIIRLGNSTTLLILAITGECGDRNIDGWMVWQMTDKF